MRRRLMLRNASGAGGFLYPLIAGTLSKAFRVTTTETGHVVMHNDSRQTAYKYANLRDVANFYTTNNIEQMSCPLWFELKAGQECVFETLNKPNYVELSLYEANSTTAYNTIVASTNTISFTVENDIEIGSVGLRTVSSVAAGTTAEFDISLIVDGRRYF